MLQRVYNQGVIIFYSINKLTKLSRPPPRRSNDDESCCWGGAGGAGDINCWLVGPRSRFRRSPRRSFSGAGVVGMTVGSGAFCGVDGSGDADPDLNNVKCQR